MSITWEMSRYFFSSDYFLQLFNSFQILRLLEVYHELQPSNIAATTDEMRVQVCKMKNNKKKFINSLFVSRESVLKMHGKILDKRNLPSTNSSDPFFQMNIDPIALYVVTHNHNKIKKRNFASNF